MKNFYLAEYIWFVEKTILYSGILYMSKIVLDRSNQS